MPSAGHCGRHLIYRCYECETKHPDTYHDDDDVQEAMDKIAANYCPQCHVDLNKDFHKLSCTHNLNTHS